ADFRQRVAHVVELERLDDCGNEFHLRSPTVVEPGGASRPAPWLEGLRGREHDGAFRVEQVRGDVRRDPGGVDVRQVEVDTGERLGDADPVVGVAVAKGVLDAVPARVTDRKPEAEAASELEAGTGCQVVSAFI